MRLATATAHPQPLARGNQSRSVGWSVRSRRVRSRSACAHLGSLPRPSYHLRDLTTRSHSSIVRVQPTPSWLAPSVAAFPPLRTAYLGSGQHIDCGNSFSSPVWLWPNPCGPRPRPFALSRTRTAPHAAAAPAPAPARGHDNDKGGCLDAHDVTPSRLRWLWLWRWPWAGAHVKRIAAEQQ